jgi:predicted nuclease with TOPRIM domain
MNELTYLTECERTEVLEETIPQIGKLQAELNLVKQRVKQLNKDEAILMEYKAHLAKELTKYEEL